jgi:hypothetical protein
MQVKEAISSCDLSLLATSTDNLFHYLQSHVSPQRRRLRSNMGSIGAHVLYVSSRPPALLLSLTQKRPNNTIHINNQRPCGSLTCPSDSPNSAKYSSSGSFPPPLITQNLIRKRNSVSLRNGLDLMHAIPIEGNVLVHVPVAGRRGEVERVTHVPMGHDQLTPGEGRRQAHDGSADEKFGVGRGVDVWLEEISRPCSCNLE